MRHIPVIDAKDQTYLSEMIDQMVEKYDELLESTLYTNPELVVLRETIENLRLILDANSIWSSIARATKNPIWGSFWFQK